MAASCPSRIFSIKGASSKTPWSAMLVNVPVSTIIDPGQYRETELNWHNTGPDRPFR